MEAEKTWENHGKNKTVIKIGGDGGSGIGAVVVLGGALATAALAAAFAVRTKGRSSGNDQNSIHKTEQDKTSDVYKHPSSAATAEVESNNDDTAVVDDKPMIEEIKGGFVSPKKLEKDAIVDGSVIVEGFPLSDEKLPFDQMMNGNEVEKRLTKEDIADEIEILEQVCVQEDSAEVRYDQAAETEATIEEDNAVVDLIEAPKNLNTKVEAEKQESDGFCSDDDGEISEEKEVIDSRNKMDLVAMGFQLSESESESSLVSESHSEAGLKSLLPVFENPFIEREKVNNGDERESSLIVVEIIHERDEAVVTEGSQEEQVSYIEEQIVTENCEQVEWTGEANQGHLLIDPIRVTEDENALLVHLTPAENREFEVPMLKEELIFPVEEASEENKVPVPVINGQPKDDEDDDDANRNITEDIKEELILAEDDQGYGANEEFNKSLELNEKPKYDDDPVINIEANQVHLLNDPIEVKEDENALLIHPTPHKNREFELPMPKGELIFPEGGEQEEVAESMEQPNEKREDDDPEISTGKEVEEDVISPANEQNAFVNGDRSEDEEEEDDDDDAETKGKVISPEDNELTETVTESMEINQNEAEDHEEEEDDDDDAEIINVESDDLSTETSEDEETSEDDAGIEHFHDDEKATSEEGEEISEGSVGESSTESIDQAEEPKREVEGKIEEDRAVKKMSGSIEKTNSKKRVMEAKDRYTRRRMLIGTVSLLSSLSCSWYLGLSSVEICFIVFFTMVISSLATSRQLRGFQHRS